jgi:hypothetical protein
VTGAGEEGSGETDDAPDDAPAATDAAGVDPVVADEAAGADGEFPPDPERVRLLREVADDVRGGSGESQQLAAILYRVSDLYDPDEATSPVEIYRNVEHIMQIRAQGGIER